MGRALLLGSIAAIALYFLLKKKTPATQPVSGFARPIIPRRIRNQGPQVSLTEDGLYMGGGLLGIQGAPNLHNLRNG